MLRLSKMTDYATVVLARLAHPGQDPYRFHTSRELAAKTRLSPATVSKLLKALHRAGLVDSCRGTHGGYALARPADSISAAEIIDALEGPVSITECSSHESQCEFESVCGVGGSWQRINKAIRHALADITLAQLADPDPAAIPRLRLVSETAGDANAAGL